MPNVCRIRDAVATVSLAILVPVEHAAHTRVLPLVVPFERAPAPYIVVRVPVAGSTCEALIFDTGTNTTVLAPTLAARGGHSNGHATKVESLNGTSPVVMGYVRGIGFEAFPADERKVALVGDVSGLRGFGKSVAGLYGHNWLTGTDYLIDYGAKHIVIGRAGTLPEPTGGHRTALTWAAGRPAVTAEIRGPATEAFPARLVLDSGADHLTLFGRAAERLALVVDPRRTMRIDSGFGPREVPTAVLTLTVGGRTRSVTVELRSDVKDRDEDGLVPTSFFRSLLVRTVQGIVVFDPPTSFAPNSLTSTVCTGAT